MSWKFLNTLRTASSRSRNRRTWTVTTRATTWPRHHHKTRDFFSNLTEFLRAFYSTFMTSLLVPVTLYRNVSLGLYYLGWPQRDSRRMRAIQPYGGHERRGGACEGTTGERRTR